MLESIRQPSDLRPLSYSQLNELSGEIRDFVVRAVSENSGHLGSNLGVVELTLALHRVFDSPHDAVLWDTGHNAYVHKIVTGRQQGFEHLRQAGGLSGYPSREESKHDFIENSHASTVLSYAYGLAVARDAGVDDRRHIVAVIGDGSMTGGMAYEALNNLGHSKRRVIIILNDNGRSYAPTISNLTDQGPTAAEKPPVTERLAEKLEHSLTSIRLNPVYVRRQRKLERFVHDLPLVGAPAERTLEAFKAAVREFLQPTSFFEALGVRYVGPVDGHDIAELEHALANAVELSAEGPIVVHVLTQKGRGYPPAEDDDEKHLHDAPVFDPAIGPPKAVPTGYTQAFADAIVKEAENDPRIVAITAAMPGPTGLLPFQARFPDRFFDVGIAEQHAVTGAAGMAMGGLRPVVALYSTFLSRAWDQVVYDVALHRAPVIFCLDRAGITGDDGPSHHGVYDMALLSKVPGMRVLAPSSAQELHQMLHDAVTLVDEGPVVIRYPKGSARQVDELQVGHGLQARRLRSGDDSVCILAVGKMVGAAEKAADQLAAAGIDATVWDVRCCAPLDPEMIADAARHAAVPHGRGRHPRRRHRDDRSRRHPSRLRRQPRPPGGASRRTHPVPPPRQARPHPGQPRARCRRHRRRRSRPPLMDHHDVDPVALGRDLELALELADLADRETLHRYESRAFTVDRKPDRSEVTEADRTAEAVVRAAVQRLRPDHALFGEEEGLVGPADAHWRWIVDPVDGTSNFVRGIPVWATLIALSHVELGPVLGVVSAPALARRWWGGRDLGAFVNGNPIRVSAIDSLADAQVCVTFNEGWDQLGLTPRLVQLQQDAWRARGFGDFWQHMLVAEGGGRDRRRCHRGPDLRSGRRPGRRRGGGRHVHRPGWRSHHRDRQRHLQQRPAP